MPVLGLRVRLTGMATYSSGTITGMPCCHILGLRVTMREVKEGRTLLAILLYSSTKVARLSTSSVSEISPLDEVQVLLVAL